MSSKILVTLTILLAVCSLAYAAGGTVLLAKAGSTTGASTSFLLPSSMYTGCSATTTTSPYVTFTGTFASSGVREVRGQTDNFNGQFAIYVYNGDFSSSAPCTNLMQIIDEDDFTDTVILRASVYFTTGVTYTFVVAGKDVFWSLNVIESDYFGTLSASNTWDAPSAGYNSANIGYTSTCKADFFGSDQMLWVQTWTQASTGTYDIISLWWNITKSTLNPRTSVYLYQGAVTMATLQNDSCNGRTFIGGAAGESSDYGDYQGNGLQQRGAGMLGAQLTAGVTYTAVLSTNADAKSAYTALQVQPSTIITSKTGFTQPDFGCTPSSNTDQDYATYKFTATKAGVYFVWAQQEVNGSEWLVGSYLYSGDNTASNPPSTCNNYLDSSANLGSDKIVAKAGQTFTYVFSSFTKSLSQPNRRLIVYMTTGDTVGNIGSPSYPSVPASNSGVVLFSSIATIIIAAMLTLL